MKQAKISDLKNNLSRYLAYVRRGGVVRVFDRDSPVAELVPLGRREGAGTEIDARLAGLERRGVVRRGLVPLPARFFETPLPKAKASVLDALLAERSEGR
jgi:antitoxin (DNA-binding transcriptional repressor) of toxin-antitoxin stability system